MLKAYSFDLDSNLFFTDTTIFLDKLGKEGNRSKIEVSQQEYEQLIKDKEHYRHVNGDIEASMINFRTPGGYEKAVFDALKNGKTGPSYPKKLEAMRYASPTQINTARGNPVDECIHTERKFIHEVLTDDQREDLVDSMQERLGIYKRNDDDFFIETYINNNMYSPCSNLEFLASIHMQLSDPMPARKNAAFERFVLHNKRLFQKYYGADFMNNRKIRIGFSDDTNKNIEGLHHFIHTKKTGLMRTYPEVLFRLYDTSETRARPTKFSYTNTQTQE